MKGLFEKLLNGGRQRRTALMIIDILCYVAVSGLFYLVSSTANNSLPVHKTETFVANFAVHLLLLLMVRWFFGVYNNIWRYANTDAYFRLVMADAIAGAVSVILLRVLHSFMLNTYYGLWQPAVVGSLNALLVLISRFVYCLLYRARPSKGKSVKPRVPVAIVGAGQLGSYLVEDLRNNGNSGYEPMFFVDVDASKIGNFIFGLKVYDKQTGHELIKKLKIQEVLVAITSQDSEHLNELYRCYTDMGCKVRIYDSLVSDHSGSQKKRVLRDFSIEDLLFRKTIRLEDGGTTEFYRDRTVLVTGGGGSIGSELCRQIAECKPRKLIIFDIYENNAYEIQQELHRQYGKDLELVVEIGSVRDTERLDELFRMHRPQIVFHAAAHKHVPLMEHCASEAIKNNVFGTYNAANAAEAYGAEKFILISTDKAVNPTNIMGASKRLCERVIQCRTDSKTSFAAVRFGNVLGSNGSVIPLFKRQIERGGPVTITDKRIIRYFMTISEASQLVIQAGVMAKAGELFVLDMGKPVKIYELAEAMIRLSGYEPDKDIEIQEIGLRPGEKLYEELLIKTEQVEKTENSLIYIERDAAFSRDEMQAKLQRLQEALHEPEKLRQTVAELVPAYRTPEEVNCRAEKAEEMQMVQ